MVGPQLCRSTFCLQQTQHDGALEPNSLHEVYLVDLRLLEVAVRLASIGKIKMVVMGGCTHTLDDFWRMLIERQIDFKPYTEGTSDAHTCISSANMGLCQSMNLHAAVWGRFDGSSTAEPCSVMAVVWTSDIR